MKVILLQELKGRGGEGDVIDVAQGFAVNYLFPRNIAIEASKGNLKQLDLRKHNIKKRETDRVSDAERTFAALDQKNVKVYAKVGEEGQLFGSITTQAVAEAIAEQHGIEIDRKKIDLHGAIKTAGEHVITIAIYRDVKAAVTVVVGDVAATAAAVADEETTAASKDAAKATEEAVAEADNAEAAVIEEIVIEEAAETTAE